MNMLGTFSVAVFFLHVTIFIPTLCNVNNSTFVPTNDWQTIKEGQAIPPGLHVRINLQTGHKEAKLMEDESSKNELAKLPGDGSEPENYLDDVQKRLKEALKNIPSDSYDNSAQRMKEIEEKYRSYKELKKELKSVDLDIKMDSEIINGLIDEYANSTKSALRSLSILDNLDYLAHQIDNALWFIDRGGLDVVVLPAIVNSTDSKIRIKALRLLGALIQNNPKAQVKALEKNCGRHLNHVLLASTNNEELSAAIYVYGGLLRKFPFAQKENLPKTGIKALVNIFTKESVELRTKLKALTLICDLIIEQQEIQNSAIAAKDDQGIRERFEQYQLVLLDFWLHDEQFCDVLRDFTVSNYQGLGKDADVLERLLQNLNITFNLCLDVFSESKGFKEAITYFRDLFHNIKDDAFMEEIAQLARQVYEKLFDKLKFNDEL